MKNNQTTTNRINELYMAIVSNEKPKPRIRKVFSYSNNNNKPKHFYVVTISKNEKSFIQRVNSFNNLLIDNLKPNENLAYNNDCFCIASDEYELSYILEGYYKQANKKGYIVNGVADEKLLCRMGFEFAIKYAKKHNAYNLAISKMSDSGWQEKFPNPADRLVALIKHERGK